jgi:hypothetical protein
LVTHSSPSFIVRKSLMTLTIHPSSILLISST